MSSRYINENVKRELYARSGNCCERYGCNNKLFDNNGYHGEICHIEAVSSGGPRYNPNLSKTELNASDNLLLLCPIHHAEIDSPRNQSIYTVEYLKKMKKDHETMVEEKLSNTVLITEPISLDTYDLFLLVQKYNELFCEEDSNTKKMLNDSQISKYLEQILSLNNATRSILYGIVDYFYSNNDVLTDRLFIENLFVVLSKLENINSYYYEKYIKDLQDQKLIKEISDAGGISNGYEDENGDFILPTWTDIVGK